MKKIIYLILSIVCGILTSIFFIKGFTPIGMLIGVLNSNSNNEIGTLIQMAFTMIKSIGLCILFLVLTTIFKNLYVFKEEKGQ